MYTSLRRHMLLFLLGRKLEVEWLGHVVGIYLPFSEFPQQGVTTLPVVPMLTDSYYSKSFILDILNRVGYLDILNTYFHRVWWYYIAILICILLIVNDAKPLFSTLFAICVTSSGMCLSKSFPIFYCIIYYLIKCFESSLYILDTGPLSDGPFANIFLPVCGLTSQSNKTKQCFLNSRYSWF